jgi:ribosomal protein S27E
MDDIIVKQSRKKIILILFLSILCLILISFLPWIAVAENDFVKDNLNFNYEMMKDSSNTQIINLVRILMNINILFWIIIITTLISFITIVCYALVKKSLFCRMLIISSSFINFILCIFIVYYQIIFSRTISNLDSISGSMIYPPFAYAYIQFILSVILLLISGSYTLVLIKDSTKRLKSVRTRKKEIRKKMDIEDTEVSSIESEIEKSIRIPDKERVLTNSSREEKLAEIDKLLSKKEPEIEKQKVEENISEQKLDKQSQTESISDEEIKDDGYKTWGEVSKENKQDTKEDKKIKQPFPEKKPKKQQEESDEIRISDHFEKALSTAIEKRQSGIKPKENKIKISKEKKIETPQIEIKKDIIEPDDQAEKDKDEEKEDKTSKILKLKCPECDHIFTFDVEKGNKKIICPKCGREGEIEIEI